MMNPITHTSPPVEAPADGKTPEQLMQEEVASRHAEALSFYADVMADLASLGFIAPASPQSKLVIPRHGSPPLTHSLNSTPRPQPLTRQPSPVIVPMTPAEASTLPTPENNPRTIKVRASDGINFYTVTRVGDAYTCNCAAGQNRRLCRHVKESKGYI